MLRVLVIDDEKDARDKMIHSIDKYQNGLSIVGTASDGFEALDQIVSLYPDIVLIDIEMPGLSGLDVIKKIREINFPVYFIIISSYNNFSYAQRAIRLGVQDYLLKPFLPADVCNAVYCAAERICAAENAISPFFAPKQEKPRAIISRMRSSLVYPFNEEHVLLKKLQAGQPNEEISLSFYRFSKAITQNNSSVSSKINCFTILYVELHRMLIGIGGNFNDKVYNPLISPENSTQALDILSSYILQLCFKIGNYFANSSPTSSAINVAIEYINMNYTKDLSLDEVAEHVGISACYLSNQFSQSLNIHFIDYIHTVRIEHAKHLLRTQPQLKGYEVAEKVGYHSSKYFSQQFKKITGQTLTQFCSAQNSRY